MPKFNALHLVLPAVWVGLLSTIAPVHAEETVHLYNWNDYFAENTLEEFQKKTGIRPILEEIADFLMRQGLDVSLESETALNTGMTAFESLTTEELGTR